MTVDTSQGTPTLGLVVEGRERTAEYSAGSGTDTLSFEYEVTKADGTVDEVSVTADSLALSGGTIRNDGGADAELSHPGASYGGMDEPPAADGPLTGFTLVDAATHTDEAQLEDGARVALDDPASGTWGFRADAAQDAEIGSVRLELSGAKTVSRTENYAPWSLYGDTDGEQDGEGLPAGDYVLRATAYAERNLGGDVLETLEVAFTVADATDTPALSVADAAAASGTLSFEVTLSAAADAAVTVDYATADGTAEAGADYESASGTLSFAAGETAKTVEVTVLADDAAESDETLTLELSNASGAELGAATATGTITDAGEPEPLREPLSASFTDVPPEHDGSTAVTLRIEFSEGVGIGYRSLRDEALSATGAAVTKAKRVDGRSDLWEIEIQPDSNDDVTVTLAGGRACGTAGAVCTGDADPQPLSSSLTATVAGPPEAPLTASFTDVPSEHDGSKAFTFRIQFSAAVGISIKTLRDEALSASGATVKKANRVDGRKDLYEIRVRPSGNADVTVTLTGGSACDARGGICTPDGRQLTGNVSATVRARAALSVADARAEEGAGAVLAFAVTLDRAASTAVSVDYGTADGSAQAGVDYTRAIGTLTFQAGETSKTIEVTVLDDAHDEGEETLTLTLSNAVGGRVADGEATGTIANRDPMPRALLARFGRTAAVHIVEQVEERVAAPREPGFRGELAGRERRPGMEREMALSFLSQLGGLAGGNPVGGGVHDPMAGGLGGGMPFGTPGLAGGGEHTGAGGRMGGAAPMASAAGPMGMETRPMGGTTGLAGGLLGGGLLQMGLGGGDPLTGSSFAMNRETRGGILSLWSRGARSHFSGREGALSLGGDVRTTMFGADYAKGPLVAGLYRRRRSGDVPDDRTAG